MAPAAGTSRSGAGDDAPLPPLRLDLQYLRQGVDPHGAPAWVIYDPLQHRYFRIDNTARELFRLWRENVTLAELQARACDEAGLVIARRQCEELLDFVRRNRLSEEASKDLQPGHVARQRSAMEWFKLIAERYLFFKVPLVRPQRFLRAAQPWVAPLFTRAAACTIGLIGIAGVYLAARQWDDFLATTYAMGSVDGALLFVLALVLIKSLHELGHALTAVRHGLHVPAMGVAFMVLAPILYTDVTDAWRLPSRRARIAIHAAGVMVELALACFALLTWALLPDGPLRLLAFAVATSGLLLTLAINMNPLLRFDGYYVFSELIGIDNLQTRAFAMGRWQLRRWLVAPSLPPPEILPARLTLTLIVYAWAAWIYRLLLFTAIAVLVYTMFFKALGIILFIAEIWLLIVRPVARELREWTQLRSEHWRPGRHWLAGAGAVLMLVLLCVPLSTHVEIPAVAEANTLAWVYPQRAGRLVEINCRSGDWVKAGAPLFRLADPALDHEIAVARNRIRANRLRLERIVADREDRQQSIVLKQEADALAEKLAGLRREQDLLTIRAPFDGQVRNLQRGLHGDRWITKSDQLALVVGKGEAMARGYVIDSDVARVQTGTVGRFVPDELEAPARTVKLLKVASAAASTITVQELASTHGGDVHVAAGQDNKLAAIRPYYLAEFIIQDETGPLDRTLRGVIQLKGEPESVFARGYRLVARVLIRESGF